MTTAEELRRDENCSKLSELVGNKRVRLSRKLQEIDYDREMAIKNSGTSLYRNDCNKTLIPNSLKEGGREKLALGRFLTIK